MTRAARIGLVLALCAPLLSACGGGDTSEAPDDVSQGEAQALADAEAMLDERAR